MLLMLLLVLAVCCCCYGGSAAVPAGSGTVGSRYFIAASSGGGAVSSIAIGGPNQRAVSDIQCASFCAGNLECDSFQFDPESLACGLYNGGGGGGGSGGSATVRFNAVDTNCPYEATVGARKFCTIQERNSASVDFQRTWTQYENGFGDGSNFWIGLKRINQLTLSSSPPTMRIRFLLFNGSEYYNEYSGFSVGNANTTYTMSYSSFLTAQSNLATDCLATHNGMKFSTKDQDNDGAPSGVCATAYGNAGFWFNFCLKCNPNGLYPPADGLDNAKYIYWRCINDTVTVLQSISIMVVQV